MCAKLKCGFIGFGRNGWILSLAARFYTELRGKIEFVAGWDPSPKAHAKLKKYRIPIANSLEDFMNTDGLDAIIINSPPQFHAEQVIMALEAGKHVYSEVPMAIKKEEVEKIINAVDQSGKQYQYGENYAFFAETLYASHLIESGLIGVPVYAEAEYLHDVTYRWRENDTGDEHTPRRESWYSLIDPLMYAHSIGPAQIALGGLSNPLEFTEVFSYANDNGGFEGKPICAPSKAFQVALFRTEENCIAKCANAYKFAREPTRMGIQVVGRTGAFECANYGKGGRLFIADGHSINKDFHRKGKTSHIGRLKLSKIAKHGLHPFYSATGRCFTDWVNAIANNHQSSLNAKVAANITMAGIASSESARTGKSISIPSFR